MRDITLHTKSFFDIPADELPQRVEVFFYDGDHCPESQRRAITHVWPVLAARCGHRR